MAEIKYVMEDDELGIRPLTLEDSALIVRWRNQDWVRRNYIYREEFTLEGQERYFREQVATGNVYQFIFCEKKNGGRPIGCYVISSISEDRKSGESGMFIGEKDAIGKGYSKKGMRLLIRYAFEMAGMDRIFCRIFKYNTPCVNGMLDFGYKVIDTLPAVQCSDGTVSDMYMMDIKKEDFV